MALAWHASLPQEMFMQANLRFAANTVHFATAAGPGKTRARSTLGMQTMSVPIVLDGSQMITFKEFFEVDLESGALPFEWQDPVTGDNKEFRFTHDNPPSFQVVKGGADPRWRGTLTLDILRDGTP